MIAPELVAQAACRGLNPDLFFPARGETVGHIKAICRECPIVQECLESALVDGEQFGIWGGTSESERRRIRRDRGLRRAPVRQQTKVVKVTHRDHGGRGEAAGLLLQLEEELHRERQPRSTRTVKDLVEEYIVHCRSIGRADTTLESYEAVVKRLWVLSDMPIADVTTHDLDVLYRWLKDEREPKLKPNSIRQTHAVLTAAFNQAVVWGWVPTNPATSATAPKNHRGDSTPLPLADVTRLVIAAGAPRSEGGDEDPVLAMAIALSSITGARRGELCGFRWDDLDTTTGTVRIERQWVRGRGGQSLSAPKSEGGVRTVGIGPQGLALVERYRWIMTELLGWQPDGWLLSHDGGATPVKPGTLGSAIKRLGERIGIEVTTHKFRKVTATQLVAAGIDEDAS